MKTWLAKNKLLILTIASVVLGVALGFALRPLKFTDFDRYYWAFAGDVIMMNMLKCIIVPLIILSITTGVASLAESSGKLSLYAIAYYMTTTVLAIILGIVMTVLIKPGKAVSGGDGYQEDTNTKPKGVQDGLLDIVRNMFPNNIVQSMFQQAFTYQEINTEKIFDETTNTTFSVISKSVKVEYGGSQNVLGLIVFFSLIGF